MYKIAFFSPLPPIESGISTYSLRLLKELSRFYTITFFVDQGYKPIPEILDYGNVVECRDIENTVQLLRGFDLAVYHFGNNNYHAYMYEIAMRVPGVVVLHDFVLHHLVGWMTLWNNKNDLYLSQVAKWYPEYLDRAKYIVKNGLTPDFFKYPFNDEVIDNSLCVIAHNNFVKNKLDQKFDKPIFVIPIMFGDSLQKKEVKKYKHDIVISCIGFINSNKRNHVVLSVFQKLAEEYPHLKLNLVGEVSPEFNKIYDFIKENKIEGRVNITGYCTDDDFNKYLMETDICVNLRYPSAGETSATLVMALGYGVPTIVSKYQQYDEYPDDVVLKVLVDVNEKKCLYSYLKMLIEDRDVRESLGQNAKNYIEDTSNVSLVVDKYRQVMDYAINTISRQKPINVKFRNKVESAIFGEIREMLR